MSCTSCAQPSSPLFIDNPLFLVDNSDDDGDDGDDALTTALSARHPTVPAMAIRVSVAICTTSFLLGEHARAPPSLTKFDPFVADTNAQAYSSRTGSPTR